MMIYPSAFGTDDPGQRSPKPKTIYEAVIDGAHRYGGFFFMYPYNRLIVRRSWFLSNINTSLFPRPEATEVNQGRYALRNKGKARSSTSNTTRQDPEDAGKAASEPVHGDSFRYEEAVLMPSKAFAWLFSFVNFSFFALFFTSSIVSFLSYSGAPTRADVPVPMGHQQSHSSAGRRRLSRVSHYLYLGELHRA